MAMVITIMIMTRHATEQQDACGVCLKQKELLGPGMMQVRRSTSSTKAAG